MSEQGKILAAFGEDHVERLTGLSRAQLRHWDRTGFFVPAFASRDRSQPFSRIYSFLDVAALRVLHALRHDHDVTLQHLRKVAKKLDNLDSSAWVQTKLYVSNRKVYFEDPRSGKPMEALTGQYPLQVIIPLKRVIAETKKAVGVLSRRSRETHGHFERHRFVAQNAEVIAGTRIPVASVVRMIEDGATARHIRQEYPSLTDADIAAVKATLKAKKAA